MALFQVGIDVSRYQGSINWSAVAAAGKQFAIVRIGSSNNNGTYEIGRASCRERV